MAKKFSELKVHAKLCEMLASRGFKEATPVQEVAIPAIRRSDDVVVQAQTGTGKTLAFLLPILEKLKPQASVVQALIVAPTRELALQITSEAKKIGEPLNIRTLAIFGGQAVERQAQKLGRGAQLAVGTPGRILDLVRHKRLDLSRVNKVVLDEADEMLRLGFIEDVEQILRQTATDRQTMFFSATIPDRIRSLARRYMRAPHDIKIKAKHVTLDEIDQLIVDTKEEDKLDRLCSLMNEMQPYLALVFCHTKQRAAQVAMELCRRGYLADELHGDLSQAKRMMILRRFSQAKLQILVATDIAARGLDIEGVTHVFNYDIPHNAQGYIHRIGRTGRAGEKGKAITFVNARQYDFLRQIEAGIESRIKKQHSLAPKRAATLEKQKISAHGLRSNGGENERISRQKGSLAKLAERINRRRGKR